MLRRRVWAAAIAFALCLSGLTLGGCSGGRTAKTGEPAAGASASPSFNPKADPRYGSPGTPLKTPYREDPFFELDDDVFPQSSKPTRKPAAWIKKSKSCIGTPDRFLVDKFYAAAYKPNKPVPYIGFNDINDKRDIALMTEGDVGVIMWDIKKNAKTIIKPIEKDVTAVGIFNKTGVLIREFWDCDDLCSKYRISFYRFKDKSLKVLDDYTKRPHTPPGTYTPSGSNTEARIGNKFYWLRGVANPKHEFGMTNAKVPLSQIVEYNPDTDKVRIVTNGGAATITPVGKYLLVPTMPAKSPYNGTQQWALVDPKDGSLHALPPLLSEGQRYTNIYYADIDSSGASLWVDPIFDPESIVWYSYDGYSKPVKVLNNHIIHHNPIITKNLFAIGTEDGGFIFDRKTGRGTHFLDHQSVVPIANSSRKVIVFVEPSETPYELQKEFMFSAISDFDGNQIKDCEPAVTPSKSHKEDSYSHGSNYVTIPPLEN